jgi:hypothetical protein
MPRAPVEWVAPTSLVSPIIAVLASEQCPVTGHTFDAGGGRVGTTFQGTNAGYYDREMTPEALLANWDIVPGQSGYTKFDNAYESLSMVQTARKRYESRDVTPGVPAEYGEMLRMFTETIASGMGSRPNDNIQKVTERRRTSSLSSLGEPRRLGHRRGPS